MNKEFNNVKELIDFLVRDSKPTYKNVLVKMPKEAKTVLISDFRNDLTAIARFGGSISPYRIMPDIKDVSVVDDNESKVVVVKFSDGESEKAVLSKEDTFNLEQGISVCITKKLLSMKCPNGSSLYNKIIKRAVNVHKDKLLSEMNALKKEKEDAERYERKHKKREQRRIRRENIEREKQIEIQKEAYLRAMREYNNGTGTETK